MKTAIPQSPGAIERQLSAHAFTTADPVSCCEWLRALDYHELPTVHRTEVCRLALAERIASVFASGLVIITPGVPR